MDRYARNFTSLTKNQQELLKDSNIAIVGLGGLGGYVLENLLRLGVQKFTLIDMDVFEVTNLNRQLLSTEKNLGNYKTEEAALRAKSINSSVKLKLFTETLNENSVHILEETDLVIDALDSISGKLNLEKLCNKMNLPLIYGAISGYYGQIALSTNDNRMVSKIYSNVEDYENTLGNLPMTCMITASLQCNLALKYLFKENIEDELIFVDSKSMTIDKIKI